VPFLGATGSQRGTQDVEITLKFEASKSILIGDGVTIGDISVPARDGWDYMWVYSVRARDGNTSTPTMNPKQVTVVRVYPRKDFSLLQVT